MNIRPFADTTPDIAADAYIDPAAVVIGAVTVGAESSLWPMAVARGDVNYIQIGCRTNIQDGTVLHVTHDHEASPGGHPLIIGDEVTVGHNVTLHGCTVEARCLVGMGSVVLDGARLRRHVLLGAGSLVPPGAELEGGYLWLGRPARRVRPLTEEELGHLAYSADHYVRLMRRHRQG